MIASVRADVYRLWVCDTDPEDASQWFDILEIHLPDRRVSFNVCDQGVNILTRVDARMRYGVSSSSNHASPARAEHMIPPPHPAHIVRSLVVTESEADALVQRDATLCDAAAHAIARQLWNDVVLEMH